MFSSRKSNLEDKCSVEKKVGFRLYENEEALSTKLFALWLIHDTGLVAVVVYGFRQFPDAPSV